MKDYFRLMFTNFDVMNNDDWYKSQHYFKWTMIIGWSLVIAGQIAVLVLKVVLFTSN